MELAPRHRSLLLLLLLALVAGGVMIARTALDGDSEPREELAGKSGPAVSGAELERIGVPPPSGLEARKTEGPSEKPVRDPVLLELRCLHHTELRPLAGIRLYRREAPIAGPSTAEGILRFEPGPSVRLTAWAEGWVPVEVPGPPFPDRVLLAPAKSILEVQLLNLESDQRVAKTLLQPHRVSQARTGPWQPELEQVAEDRYQVLQLAPGTYDVYFWVAQGTGAPRAYERRELEVLAGRLNQTSLDVSPAAAGADEEDW